MGLFQTKIPVDLLSKSISIPLQSFGVKILHAEILRSESDWDASFRIGVDRRPGDLGMGGIKHYTAKIDDINIRRMDNPRAFYAFVAQDAVRSICASYWTDYIIKIRY